jgi:hypothetical protein
MDDATGVVLVGYASDGTASGTGAAGEATPDVLASRLSSDLVPELGVKGTDVYDFVFVAHVLILACAANEFAGYHL